MHTLIYNNSTIYIQRSGIHAHVDADLTRSKSLLVSSKHFISTDRVAHRHLDSSATYYPVIGPGRKYNQLEIPASMAHKFNVPIHYTQSGHLDNAPICYLEFRMKYIPFHVVSVYPHIHIPSEWDEEDTMFLTITEPKLIKIELLVIKSPDIENPCIHLDPDEYAAMGLHSQKVSAYLE